MHHLTSAIFLVTHVAMGADLGDLLSQHITSHPVIGDSTGFGGKAMERTFLVYNSLPINETQLKAQGWVKQAGLCDKNLGWEWAQTKDGVVTDDKPLVLYTTQGGQISGVGLFVKGDFPPPQQKWSQKKYGSGWKLEVAFRQGDILCSGKMSDTVIGDAVIVNPNFGEGGEKKVIPLSETDAKSEGWHRGACFDGMGWHNFLDTSLHNTTMSWKAGNLFPVVAMYSGGSINSIFFATWNVQQGLRGANQWEPRALKNAEMCKNTCDRDCTFEGAHSWSTMHIYFRDHTTVKCESDLKCAIGSPGSGRGMACCTPSESAPTTGSSESAPTTAPTTGSSESAPTTGSDDDDDWAKQYNTACADNTITQYCLRKEMLLVTLGVIGTVGIGVVFFWRNRAQPARALPGTEMSTRGT